MIDRWNFPEGYGVARTYPRGHIPSPQPEHYGCAGVVPLDFKLPPVTYDVRIVAGKITIRDERGREIENNTGAA